MQLPDRSRRGEVASVGAPELVALTFLIACASLMAAGYALDLAGSSMRPSLLVVVFLSVPLIATAAVVKGRIRVSAAAGEAVMFGAVLSATAA